MTYNQGYSPDSLVQLRHDGLARVTLYRRKLHGARFHCSWCGTYRNHMFQYTWQSDADNGPVWFNDKHQFCNQECWRSYHA